MLASLFEHGSRGSRRPRDCEDGSEDWGEGSRGERDPRGSLRLLPLLLLHSPLLPADFLHGSYRHHSGGAGRLLEVGAVWEGHLIGRRCYWRGSWLRISLIGKSGGRRDGGAGGNCGFRRCGRCGRRSPSVGKDPRGSEGVLGGRLG